MSRSGASTVSEIAAIGRPAILVPYPHALDHDQAANAAALEAAGGAILSAGFELDAQDVAAVQRASRRSRRLAAMANAARKAGKPEATALLADLVEAIASGRTAAPSRRAEPSVRTSHP
jgi:UDP-N-acetylglucosamine--N-acetylmuramyl-(pentapeptide) pyrophosphoryl-undecaprenol N-acetylglucosamine transferase